MFKMLTKVFGGRSAARATARPPRRACPGVEALEERLVMSGITGWGDPPPSSHPWSYAVPSGHGSDTIVVSAVNNQLQVVDNNVPVPGTPLSLAGITSIALTGGGSTRNTFDVVSTPAGLPVSINLTTPSDSVYVGWSSPYSGWSSGLQGIMGNVIVNGVKGATGPAEVTVDDSSDAAAHGANMTGSAVTGLAPAVIAYSNVYSVVVKAGSSPNNSITLSDWGPTHNTFTGAPGKSTLTGPGYSLEADNFAAVDAVSYSPASSQQVGASSAGSATVTGLASTSALVVGQPVYGPGIPQNTTIAAVPGPTSIALSNAATATGPLWLVFSNGGTTADSANLTGSARTANTFTAAPSSATLAGVGYSLKADGFYNVTATAASAADTAGLTGLALSAYQVACGDFNTFTGSPSSANLTGPYYSVTAKGFASVTANSNYGQDLAVLNGSPTSANTYVATAGSQSMSGPGFSLTARGFARVQPHGQMVAWFLNNIQDPAVRSAASADFYRDNALSPADMMDVFDAILQLPAGQNSESLYRLNSGAAPTAAQAQDLQTLLGNGNLLGMPAYVQYLTNQVIHPSSDDLNAFNNWSLFSSTPPQFNTDVYLPGNPEGKTTVASPTAQDQQSWQMQYLINEWFLGGEPAEQGFGTPLPGPADSVDGKVNGNVTVPTSPYSVPGGSLSLFGPSGTPVVSDVQQGQLGDCQLMASLAEVAYRAPNVIANMIADNHNGSYTVCLYNYSTHQPFYVTVNDELPNAGKDFSRVANGVLWPALAEKAIAQWAGNSYQNLSGDLVGNRAAQEWLQMITNRPGDGGDFGYLWSSHAGDVASALAQGQFVCLGTGGNYAIFGPSDPGVEGGHEYAVLSYNPSTDQFLLYNPWGLAPTNITADVSATATTIQVASASEIAAGDVIQISNEQMLITGVAGNTLTVQRGVHNTAPAGYTRGAAVSLVFYSGSPFAGTPVPSAADSGIYGLLAVNGDTLGHAFNYWGRVGAPAVRGSSVARATGFAAPADGVATTGPVRAPSVSPGGPGSADSTGDTSPVAPVRNDPFASASLAARFLDAVFVELRSSRKDSAGDFTLGL